MHLLPYMLEASSFFLPPSILFILFFFLSFFHCLQLNTKISWEEGTLVEKMPPSEWPEGKCGVFS